jgi:hypothetical protein
MANKNHAIGMPVFREANFLEEWLLRSRGEEEEKKVGDQSPFAARGIYMVELGQSLITNH